VIGTSRERVDFVIELADKMANTLISLKLLNQKLPECRSSQCTMRVRALLTDYGD
jgi:hypothetical protein